MSTQPEKVVEMVNIEVDGQAMEVPKNSMIIEATDKAGISIPRFCYHPALGSVGACRMCEVEVGGRNVMSCLTPVADGLDVKTDTPAIRAAR